MSSCANYTVPLNGDMTMKREDETKKGGLKGPNKLGKSGPKALFALGDIWCSRAATEELPNREVRKCLGRHVRGDWGNLTKRAWSQNDRALKNGGSLASVYHTRRGMCFWIVTSSDRTKTSVVVPAQL